MPAPHGAHARRPRRAVVACSTQAVDGLERRSTQRELGLGPATQVTPRVRARPPARRRTGERREVRRERPPACRRETPVRLPQPLQRDHEVAAAAAALELRRRVSRAQPDGDAVRHPQRHGQPARAVGADRAHRLLDRYAVRLVEGGCCHDPSVPGRSCRVGHEACRTCDEVAHSRRRAPRRRGRRRSGGDGQLTSARTAKCARPHRSPRQTSALATRPTNQSWMCPTSRGG